MAANGDALKRTNLEYDWKVFAKSKGLEQFGSNSKVKAIDGGAINYVYRMTSDKDTTLSVIVKHGDDHIKDFPHYPLAGSRTTVEFWGMKMMDEILPGSVPTPLLYDPSFNYIVMEDLGSYDLLREKLKTGDLDLSVLDIVSRNIAKLHQFTHKATLTKSEHQKLVDISESSGMRSLAVMHVFKDPIDRKGAGKYHREVDEFQKDEVLWGNWTRLKAIDEERRDCLIHGDFHTSSVMIKGRSVKIFDFEFAHMGPPGNDIGHMLANLIKSYLDHVQYPSRPGSTFHRRLAKAIYNLVDTYFQEAKAYMSAGDYSQTISETAGFTGVRLIRRVWGLAEIGDEPNKPLTERELLRTGYRLLRDFPKISTTKVLKEYLLNENA